ncbi:sulfatase-like hydrolase/transferase [Vallitalea guaymasensis]|uniref:sulfatase-like hydrolase/transferase n=1 Tax=Vallitalea guaymasensis TaxID=1185412 RepID=UPI000DE3E938|nr:sulfatase-like hydrolase/transferase [Vallitalea guaymasensis]
MNADKRPNILFLMSDEHRYDVAGFAGNEIIRTECLDKLAEDAIIFENAYTPAPICIPARQCMASGQLPRTCQVERYGEDLTPNYRTFAREFGEYAYNTVAAGKLHHFGIDQMQGYNRRLSGDCHISPRFIHNKQQDEFKRYQQKSDDSMDWNRLKWNDEKEIRRAGIGKSPNYIEDEMATQATINYVMRYFLDSYYDRPQKEQPLFLYLGMNNPHYPYITEESLFDYYLNRIELYENQTPFKHNFLGKCPFMPGALIPGENIPTRSVKRAMAAYYGNIETIDNQYQRVLTALENAGENLDDWIIIYTSDHGEMLGEHGIWEKQKFFEGSVKVPLFIRYPKRFKKAKRIKENVNLCDLFATLCDLAGIPIPEGLDSRSLVPLMEGDNQEWNNETISQFNGQNIMIKQNQLKYQWYDNGDEKEVLFDLLENPDENINFIQEDKYKTDIERFRKRCSQLGFGDSPITEYKNAGY